MKDLKDKPVDKGINPSQTLPKDSIQGTEPGFTPFGDIDPDAGGVEVGLITAEKFKFENAGDRLVGYLMRRRVINMKDTPVVYELENIEGEFSFFGSRLVNDRMKEVPDNIILDITYTDEKFSQSVGRKYKNYRVKFYVCPSGFDTEKHLCGLDTKSNKIKFIDRPPDSELPGVPF